MYGWSELPISYKGALDLFSTFHVFPEMYTYLSAFGRKSFPRDESFAGFDCAETVDENGALKTIGTSPLYLKLGICQLLNFCLRIMLFAQIRRTTRGGLEGDESVVNPPRAHLPEGGL